MATRVMRRCVVLALAVILPACALTEDVIEVRPQGLSPPPSVLGAEAVAVSVSGQDERTSNRNRVSVKKNGYGMEMASIIASNDVVIEVARTVETTLQGMGFRTDQDRDGAVTVELLRMWNDFKIGFWSGQAVAELNATLIVRGRDGRVVYTRTYGVEATVPGILLASGGNAQLALSQALDRLAERVGTDRGLAEALLGLASSAAPARPIPALPQRRRESIPQGGTPLS